MRNFKLAGSFEAITDDNRHSILSAIDKCLSIPHNLPPELSVKWIRVAKKFYWISERRYAPGYKELPANTVVLSPRPDLNIPDTKELMKQVRYPRALVHRLTLDCDRPISERSELILSFIEGDAL